jgi:hypothetical protein
MMEDRRCKMQDARWQIEIGCEGWRKRKETVNTCKKS